MLEKRLLSSFFVAARSLFFATAALVLSAAGGVTITISPTTATVPPGGNQTFTATVSGSTNKAVTWSVSTNGGAITSSGVYTAPTTVGTYTVTATSQADTTKKASATVTVPITVQISPTTANVAPGGTATFTAAVLGSSNQSVTWSVSSGGGSITPAGVYTAPATAGTYTVTATSAASSSATAAATVTVATTITVTPGTASIPMSQPTNSSGYANPSILTLHATVNGLTDQRIIWTSSGGTISNSSNAPTATFQAPQSSGTFTITAKSYADRKTVGTATVTVGSYPPLITSFTLTTPTSGTATLNGPTVRVTAGQTVNWNWEVAGALQMWYSVAGSGGQGFWNTGTPSCQACFQTKIPDVSSTSLMPFTLSPGGSFSSSSATIYLEVHPRGTITSVTPSSWTAQPGGTISVTPVFNGTGTASWGGTTIPIQSGTAFPVTMTPSPLTVSVSAYSDQGVLGDTKYITLYPAGPGRFVYVGAAGFSPGNGLIAVPGSPTQIWLGIQGSGLGFRGFDATTNTLSSASTAFNGNAQVSLATANDVQGPFVLDDGRVVVFGPDRSTIGIYDPSTQRSLMSVRPSWSPATGTAIRGAIAPLGSGRFLVLGQDGSASTFDIRTCTFSATIASGQARLDPDLTVLANGRVLISGGKNPSGTPLATVAIYDPVAQTFTATGTMLNARFRHRGILLPSGKVLISGGIAGGSGALELFDPTTGTFTAAGTGLYARQAHTTTLLTDGRVLIAGGTSPIDGTGVVGSEFYVPGTGAIVQGPYLQRDTNSNDAGPYTYAIPMANGQVLFGGGTSTQSTDAVFIFDPQTTLQVQPAVGDIHPDQTLTLTPSESVTWAVQEGAAGGSVNASGVYTPPTAPGTYHVVATSAANSTRVFTSTVVVQARPQATITSFTASATTFPSGTSATITPVFSGGTGSIQGLGTVTSGTPVTVSPAFTNTYFLDVVDANGLKVTSSLTLHVTPVLTSFTVSAPVVVPGGSVTVQWASLGASSATLLANGTAVATNTSGSFMTTLSATTTFTIQISSSEGGVTQSLQVLVSPVLSISISPTAATLYVGQAMTFGSSITSSGSPNVTWSSTGGSLTPNGGQAGFSATTPGVYTVTVTAVADTTRSASATVTVKLPDVALSISPAQTAVLTGGSISLGTSIQVTGSNDASVTWSTTGGSVLAKGGAAFFTAPLTSGVYSVTATSVANPGVSATATIQVSNLAVAVPYLSLTPSQATLVPGQRLFLGTDYAVSDPSGGLSWASSNGALQVGASTASAFYIAPAAAGTYTVTATGVANPTLTATTSIQVVSTTPAAFNVMPSAATLGTGQSILLEGVDASGNVIPVVQWSVQENGGGIITGAGQYFAPVNAGVYHAVATNPLNAAQTATATITVVSGGGGSGGTPQPTTNGVGITPSTTQIEAGAYISLDAHVAGLDDQSVTWAVENAPAVANVNSTGSFSATNPGTYRVFATSVSDPSLSGSAVITVVTSLQAVAGAPTSVAIRGRSATALADGRILLAGGFDGTNYLALAQIYDPSTTTFTSLPSMTRARAYHAATLLADGRVLLAGGVAAQGSESAMDIYGQIYAAEIFDPVAGTFVALPSPSPNGWPGKMRGAHAGGDAITLSNGQVLVVGGRYSLESPINGNGWYTSSIGNTERWSDLFAPASNLFDVSNPNTTTNGWLPGLDSFNTRHGARAAALDDGRVLIAGGMVPPVRDATDPCTGLSNTTGNYDACVENEAWVFDPASGLTQLPPMNVSRSGHTMTKLADGRVLIAGGTTAENFIANPPSPNFDPQEEDLSTNTAEIYDPKAGTFTLTGNLNNARSGHAAILLPDGQVMIVGGRHDLGNGTYAYPQTVELFDPETGQFRIMENLGYGLDDPKLALTKNGDTFISGIAQVPQAGSIAGSRLRMAVAGSQPAPGTQVTSTVSTGSDIKIVATVNQATERFVDDGDQAAIGKALSLLWKAQVPFVAQRPGRIRVQAFDRLSRSLKGVTAEVNINGNVLPLTRSTLKLQDGVPDLVKAINQTSSALTAEGIFSDTQFVPAGQQPDPYLVTPSLIRVTLSSTGKLPKPIVSNITPSIRQSMPMVVNYYPLRYERMENGSPVTHYIGDNNPTTPTDLTNLTTALQQEIYQLFPVSKGQFQIQPLTPPAAIVWNENVATAGTQQGSLLVNGAWDNLISFWRTAASTGQSDQYFMLLVPAVSGSTVPTTTGQFTAGKTNLGQHFPCGLDFAEQLSQSTWSPSTVAMNNMVHELGHAYGSNHAAPQNTKDGSLFASLDMSRRNGCAYNGKLEDSTSIESQWVNLANNVKGYSRGLIGVPGYDVVNSQPIDPTTHADIMDYCDTKWVSDYTYQNWWANRLKLTGYPAVTISSPAEGAQVTAPVQVQIDISDDVGLASAVVKLDNALYQTIPNPGKSISISLQSSDLTGGSGGIHLLSVSITDVIGRSSIELSRSFQVSTP